MGNMLAIVIGANEWANHQHGGACGAHEAGQKSTDGQDAGVQTWATMQIAPDKNTTRDSEQGGQQNNERNVFR